MCKFSVYFARKNLLFLFYTFIFTKHLHQFIYSTHLFNKIFILFTFFIISFPLPPRLLRPHPHPASNPSTKSGHWFTDLPQQQSQQQRQQQWFTNLPQQQNPAIDSPIFYNNNHNNNDIITITTTLIHLPSMFDQFFVIVSVSKRIVGSKRLIGVPNSLAAQTRRLDSVRGTRDLRWAIIVFVFEAWDFEEEGEADRLCDEMRESWDERKRELWWEKERAVMKWERVEMRVRERRN